MDDFLTQFKDKAKETINFLREELKTIRTGRANPSLVENILVETYGGQTKLKLYELASITTEGPTIIVILPFDPSTIQDIEKAILKNPINLSPKIQGNKIIIQLPPLSFEQREKFIKLLNQKVEEIKNRLRNIRDDIRKKIRQSFQEKIINEDTKFRLEKEIDKINEKIMDEIQILQENKKREIIEL